MGKCSAVQQMARIDVFGEIVKRSKFLMKSSQKREKKEDIGFYQFT